MEIIFDLPLILQLIFFAGLILFAFKIVPALLVLALIVMAIAYSFVTGLVKGSKESFNKEDKNG